MLFNINENTTMHELYQALCHKSNLDWWLIVEKGDVPKRIVGIYFCKDLSKLIVHKDYLSVSIKNYFATCSKYDFDSTSKRMKNKLAKIIQGIIVCA